MNFIEVYTNVIKLFPSILDFQDGIIVTPKPSKNLFFSQNMQKDSLYSQTISQSFVKIKEKIEKSDLYTQTMAWTIYQWILTHSHKLFELGKRNFKIEDVNMEDIKAFFIKDMEDVLDEDEYKNFKLE